MDAIEIAGALLGIYESGDSSVPLRSHILKLHNNSVRNVIKSIAIADFSNEDAYSFYKLYKQYERQNSSPSSNNIESRAQSSYGTERPESTQELEELSTFLGNIAGLVEMQHKQIRLHRAPNIVVFDDSIQSFLAVEASSHFWIENIIHVYAIRNDTSKNTKYLATDILQRYEKHYLVPPQFVSIDSVDEQSAVKMVEYKYINSGSRFIVIGMKNNTYSKDPLSDLINWAAWISPYPLVLVKQTSSPMPFNVSSVPRKWILCIKSIDNLEYSFHKVLELMRPSDLVVFYSIVETSEPRSIPWGHSYKLDFIKKENSPDWNKEEIDQLRGEMESMIGESRVFGEINFEVRSKTQSVAEQMCDSCVRERADFMVLCRGTSNRVSKECVSVASASVVLL
jgi:hypothetical protein